MQVVCEEGLVNFKQMEKNQRLSTICLITLFFSSVVLIFASQETVTRPELITLCSISSIALLVMFFYFVKQKNKVWFNLLSQKGISENTEYTTNRDQYGINFYIKEGQAYLITDMSVDEDKLILTLEMTLWNILSANKYKEIKEYADCCKSELSTKQKEILFIQMMNDLGYFRDGAYWDLKGEKFQLIKSNLNPEFLILRNVRLEKIIYV